MIVVVLLLNFFKNVWNDINLFKTQIKRNMSPMGLNYAFLFRASIGHIQAFVNVPLLWEIFHLKILRGFCAMWGATGLPFGAGYCITHVFVHAVNNPFCLPPLSDSLFTPKGGHYLIDALGHNTTLRELQLRRVPHPTLSTCGECHFSVEHLM